MGMKANGGARRGAGAAGFLVLAAVAAGCAGGMGEDRPASVMTSDEYDAARGEVVLSLAPVDLPANTGHHAVDQPPASKMVVPLNGWLQGYTVELVDAAGRQVPREVLHHVNILRPERRELFSSIMQRVGAAGSETDDVRLPRLLGYPIGAGDSLIMIAEFHNPTPDSYEGVRLRVRMPHTAHGEWPAPLRIYPFYVDVTPPAAPHGFDLPVGRSEVSWEGQPAVSGRILGMGGHLHTYAVELRLEDVTEGRTIWRTEPIRDENGAVVGMPQSRLWWRLGLPIDREHTYRLVAVYDNTSGAPIPDGGMGALGGIIVPSRGEEWPSVDPGDEQYLEDYTRRVTNRGGRASDHGDAGHHHHRGH